MFPVLLEFGPLRLFGYGAAIALGGVLTFRVMWLRRARIGLKDDESYWALLNGLLLSGFGGGHLLYLAEYARPGTPEFRQYALSLSAGYSVFGGFIGASLFVVLFARWKKIPVLRLADTVFWCALFAHVFGRLGCFLAGCCYGRPTSLPWGITFHDPRAMLPPSLLGVPLHPTQLYEAVGNALFAAALWRVLRASDEGRLAPGLVVAGHFAAYGAMRFALEPLRGDTLPLAGALTVGQGLGLGLLAASGAVLVWRRRCTPSC
ncbi:MAG: prolipoprotein diacylglyceryl transferase [Elusimicrobia bacterium]|nr:prolipoprotein diacylglyceryl transferase [Elusimicrobiota bacterium]